MAGGSPRLRAGIAGRLLAPGAAALALVAALAVAASVASADPRERPRPLAYHATVLNGAITGSSFLIADGVAVTNAHVLGGRGSGALLALLLPGQPGRRVAAEVLAVSPLMDLAILRVPPGLLPVAPAADAPLGRGLVLRAAGVVAEPGGPGPRLELAGRIVSEAVTIQPFGPGLIVHLPGVRRGFSGGPVLDGGGRLVGMVAALRPAPGDTLAATGAPLAGRDAFVLTAPAIRAEAERLLAAADLR